ncbi:MAG: InlB B-repeat-containing protein [Bacteroidaceae bacterium]|nr:InlB B-repeat-containing protein [Bacteroidaceae bacterium]
MNRTDRHITLWMAALCMAVAAILHSCTDDLGIEAPRPTEVVCFTAILGSDSIKTSTRSTAAYLSIVEEEWQLEGMPADTASSATRATLTESLSGNVQVLGISSSNVQVFNKTFTFSEYGDELTSATPIYWKNIDAGTQLDVYAYAPTTLNWGSGSFSYTIPEVANQQDIIVAKSVVVEEAFRTTIPLTFTHALTAVRFKLGEDIEADKVASITISGVYNTGTYTIGGEWSGQSTVVSYTTMPDALLMLMPQTLPDDAKVTLTFNDDTTPAISASLKGQKWEAGRLITYTLHKSTTQSSNTIYFDLAAGNVAINGTNYSGNIYVNGVSKPVTGTHSADNTYYVYQSTTSTDEKFQKFNKDNTGYATEADFTNKQNCRIPKYDPVKAPDGRLWSDFITNNTSVETVIETWDDGKYIRAGGTNAPIETLVGTAVVRDVGRTHTLNSIKVTGTSTYKLTIDNLYSAAQNVGYNSGTTGIWGRQNGGIGFCPSRSGKGSELTVNIVGDNRFGNIHYESEDSTGHKLIFEGTGSMTVADVDFITNEHNGGGIGYLGNVYCSVIGSHNGNYENSHGIQINSGTIFSGSTAEENCSAIGGGGNGETTITINGGTVTAVATTTGTAIGGGIGFNNEGGGGEVIINGGHVYAYNLENIWGIASSAIGGAGSRYAGGQYGNVTINAGYVYAYSALGTAIGGGSSLSTYGGDAVVTITGGTIIARSGTENASIGGGTGGTGYNDRDKKVVRAPGGNAKIKISGNPIIRTGSIGGGKTNDVTNVPRSKMGFASITVDGGDTQAQFVLAAGSGGTPSFTMTGGTIRNSNTNNLEDKEYLNIVENGGAVYLEDGTCEIRGGTIKNCTAPHGGAIYQKGGTITLSGGVISDNLAKGGHGGGIYIEEGSFFMPAGSTASITKNSAVLRGGQGGNGGGLYVTSDEKDVTVDILSGSITHNTSDRRGGGVCVDMSETGAEANVTVGTDAGDGPTIESNHTLLSGGGLYVSGVNADITINGGKIKGNTTSAYVPNVDVANEGGMVTLNEDVSDENVPCVTVTFHSNDGNNLTKTQKIVTSTNSLLSSETFTRQGYSFKGWNTRADGKGTGYTPGQVMNISEDIDLYAQWGIE